MPQMKTLGYRQNLGIRLEHLHLHISWENGKKNCPYSFPTSSGFNWKITVPKRFLMIIFHYTNDYQDKFYYYTKSNTDSAQKSPKQLLWTKMYEKRILKNGLRKLMV